jgi:hypothetical protein
MHHRVEYDDSKYSEPVDFLLIEAADFLSEDPADLPPLIEYIDPDALNTLLTHNTPEGADVVDWAVEFRWGEILVSVASTGEVEFIHPESEDTELSQLLEQSAGIQSLSD